MKIRKLKFKWFRGFGRADTSFCNYDIETECEPEKRYWLGVHYNYANGTIFINYGYTKKQAIKMAQNHFNNLVGECLI